MKKIFSIVMLQSYLKCIAALLFVFPSSYALSQTATIKAIKIDNVKLERDRYDDDYLDYVVSSFSLEERKYDDGDAYWVFSESHVSDLTNISGSIKSCFTSGLLDISITNNNQELILDLKNNSNFWIGFGVGDFLYNIRYYKNGLLVDYPPIKEGMYVSYATCSLFEYKRGLYDYILLPPGAQKECRLFKILGELYGYDIIHASIKNGSIMFFTIPIILFLSPPYHNTYESDKFYGKYRYHNGFCTKSLTPVELLVKCDGWYLRENEEKIIHTCKDYIEVFKFDKHHFFVSEEEYKFNLKFKCYIELKSDSIPVYKNKYGLYVYDKWVHEKGDSEFCIIEL